MAPGKQFQISFLETCCTGSYMAAGQWRAPDDINKTKDTLEYYLNLAQLAEKGKVSCIFFADWYAGFEVYTDSMDPMLQGGHQVAHLDPVPILAAMSAVTKNVSFAATASTSYVNPYILARQFSTIDHLTKGRCGWNIVTSWSKAAAKALGQDDVIPHDERYVMADEYMDIIYKLWESSWSNEAPVWDAEAGLAYDASKIKKIEHMGKYFKMSGRSQVHPSPQRTPVLFQAGTSKTGTAFAVKHAEAIFLNTATIAQAKATISAARAAAEARGRDPRSLKFFPCIVPIIGRTEEEAKQKYETALKYADPIAGLGQFSGYTGIDLSKYPLDEPFDLAAASAATPGVTAIQSVLKAFDSSNSSSTDGPWTPRRLGVQMAMGGLHPCPVGSVEQIADVFQQWAEEADCDGFNVAYVSNPSSLEDVVGLLIPELQRRGVYWTDYPAPGGTFRENLYGTPGDKFLREDHYGSSFKFPNEGPVGRKPEQEVKEEKKDETVAPKENEVSIVPVEAQKEIPIQTTQAVASTA